MAFTTAEERLTSLLPDWHLLLQGWSADGRLTAAAQEALLLDGAPQPLTDLVTQLSSGDFSALPPIVLLSATDINGAMGAYAISTGTIYLNADWLATATQDQVNAVLTEELGHHLDGVLNVVDTPGDEGEHFSILLNHEGTIQSALLAGTSNNDEGTVLLYTGQAPVERAADPSVLTRAIALTLYAEQGANVTIPENFTIIASEAFQDIPITSVTLPSNLREIANYAFSRTQLSTINIPPLVHSIYTAAFYETPLESISGVKG